MVAGHGLLMFAVVSFREAIEPGSPVFTLIVGFERPGPVFLGHGHVFASTGNSISSLCIGTGQLLFSPIAINMWISSNSESVRILFGGFRKSILSAHFSSAH